MVSGTEHDSPRAPAHLVVIDGVVVGLRPLFVTKEVAAQVLGCLAAWEDDTFCREVLGLPGPAGSIPRDRLNVDGGAIGIGHPVGASGNRIVLHLINAMRQRGLKRGIASQMASAEIERTIAVSTDRFGSTLHGKVEAITDGVRSSNMCLATVLVSATMVVTSAWMFLITSAMSDCSAMPPPSARSDASLNRPADRRCRVASPGRPPARTCPRRGAGKPAAGHNVIWRPSSGGRSAAVSSLWSTVARQHSTE